MLKLDISLTDRSAFVFVEYMDRLRCPDDGGAFCPDEIGLDQIPAELARRGVPVERIDSTVRDLYANGRISVTF